MTRANPLPSNTGVLYTTQDEDQDLPPSYNSLTPSPSFNPTQLQHLATQLITTRTLQSLHITETDSNATTLISALLPSFFSAFAATGLQQGTLIAVPATAVSEDAVLAGQDLFAGQFLYVRRVGVKEKSKKEKSEKGGRETSGRGLEDTDTGADTDAHKDAVSWWRDGEMARRVAGYLEPARECVREVVTESVESKSPAVDKTRSWWRRKTSDTANESRVKRIVEEPRRGNEVTMRVKAEEVAFRRANAFGLYETESGFAIVVRLCME